LLKLQYRHAEEGDRGIDLGIVSHPILGASTITTSMSENSCFRIDGLVHLNRYRHTDAADLHELADVKQGKPAIHTVAKAETRADANRQEYSSPTGLACHRRID
jgi:hypothetical protein